MNSAKRVLQCGKMQLHRNYCARRTKSPDAKSDTSAFASYQREVYEDVKLANPLASSYTLKQLVGQQWRGLPDDEKAPFLAPIAVGAADRSPEIGPWRCP